VTIDRTEAAGVGAAVIGHAAIAAALYYLVDYTREEFPVQPASASMEVSFVDEAGLVSAGAPEPAAASFAPETGAPEEAAPPPADLPQPTPQPDRPTPDPAPSQRTDPAQRSASSSGAPARQQSRPSQQSGSGRGQANRGARVGPDLLKGIGDDPASRSQRPTGAVMSSQARADIGSLISRQVQPCANRQSKPGPGAERIRVSIRLRLNRNGSLASAPEVIGQDGVDESNRHYLERVIDNTIATFTGCSPLRGLPEELYDVPSGWRVFTLRYRLPG
jgi:type IV secretory pathway VirB10-like protein